MYHRKIWLFRSADQWLGGVVESPRRICNSEKRMKTEEAFEPTVWAKRLAMALEDLAPRMGTSVPEEVGGLARANRSAGIRSDEPSDVSAALR